MAASVRSTIVLFMQIMVLEIMTLEELTDPKVSMVQNIWINLNSIKKITLLIKYKKMSRVSIRSHYTIILAIILRNKPMIIIEKNIRVKLFKIGKMNGLT